MSHDTHDDDDDERGEGAVVRGTDRVIKSRDSSIKTKRWLPSQTPPQNHVSRSPGGSRRWTGERKPRIREDRARQVNRQVSPAAAGLHLHVSTSAGNPGTSLLPAPVSPAAPVPPGHFETFPRGPDKFRRASLKSGRQLRGYCKHNPQ